jgi:hypothetical protein
MGLAASPSSVTAPLLHTGVGSLSKIPTCKQGDPHNGTHAVFAPTQRLFAEWFGCSSTI